MISKVSIIGSILLLTACDQSNDEGLTIEANLPQENEVILEQIDHNSEEVESRDETTDKLTEVEPEEQTKAIDQTEEPIAAIEAKVTEEVKVAKETTVTEEIVAAEETVEAEVKTFQALGEEIHCESLAGDKSVTGFIDFYDLVDLTEGDIVVVSVDNTTQLNVNSIPISKGCITISDVQQLPIAYTVNYKDSDLILDHRHKASTEVTMKMNLPAADYVKDYENLDPFEIDNVLSYNNSTSVTVYDSLGASHVMTYYFIKESYSESLSFLADDVDFGTPDTWLMYIAVDGILVNVVNDSGSKENISLAETEEITSRVSASGQVGTRLVFNPNGDLKKIYPEKTIITEALGTDILVNGANSSQAIVTNFNLIPDDWAPLEPTQFASNFEVTYLNQDGYPDSIDGYDYTLRFYYYSLLSDGSYELKHQSDEPVWVITNGYGNIADTILTSTDAE